MQGAYEIVNRSWVSAILGGVLGQRAIRVAALLRVQQ